MIQEGLTILLYSPPLFVKPIYIHLEFKWQVEDIETIIVKLKKKGTEIFSKIQQESYKLYYVRGPKGIIVELAEKIRKILNGILNDLELQL